MSTYKGYKEGNRFFRFYGLLGVFFYCEEAHQPQSGLGTLVPLMHEVSLGISAP